MLKVSLKFLQLQTLECPTCLHSAVDLESFTAMESLPLTELDFGLQKPTGPSSGVVASLVLVSPGVSLAEVCAEVSLVVAWSLK